MNPITKLLSPMRKTYEDIIDEEEEARIDFDLRRFSSDHHYQMESNEWLR